MPITTRNSLRYNGVTPLTYKSENVGPLTDYRHELSILTRRIQIAATPEQVFPSSRHFIIAHSLVDSLAYPTVRLYNMVNSGSVSDEELFRWTLLLNTNALVLKDTFRTDWPVFFLKGNDGEPFSQDLEEALEAILNDWGIPHKKLTDPWIAAKLVSQALMEEDDSSSTEVAASIVGEND